jgi:DNA-binding NarL/FixJ family response regulator
VNVRVLILDDEQLALSRLSRLLQQIEGVDVIGALDSASEAVTAIEQLHPDLVLLDIEMPQLDGFDVVEALVRSTRRGMRPRPSLHS